MHCIHEFIRITYGVYHTYLAYAFFTYISMYAVTAVTSPSPLSNWRAVHTRCPQRRMKRKRQKTGQKHRTLACSFVSSVRLFVCVHDTHIPRSSVYVTLSSFSRLLKRLLGSINIYIQISQREYSQLQKTAAELLLRSLYAV